ncbi:MAG: mucoidy inhibitor MuiA family protein [Bacteroidia bacterium]|nr:mucoidy inhibitor MuiA family protein [Bacteroidia bacterium]
MTKFITILTTCLFFIQMPAQQEIRTKSKIQKAEVYLAQALLSHQTPAFNLNKGHQTVIVENIATSVIPNTIQISGKGNFVILSSQFQLNYIPSKSVSKKIQQLEDTLEYLQSKKNNLDIQLKTFEDEENLLIVNKSIGGQNTGVSVTELEKMANFYRTRLNDIRSKKSELTPKIKKLKEQIDNIQNQLNELNTQKNKPAGEIHIEIYANDNVNNAQLSIEYICTNTYWYPEYEIRVNDLKQPAQLLLKAQIVQNTGIDWENIQLSLSTSSPVMSHSKPELTPWWLSYSYNYPKKVSRYKYKGKEEMNAPSVAYSEVPAADKEGVKLAKSAENTADYTQSVEKATTQQFQIQIPVNIPSNNKPTRIDVQTQNIDAHYTYYTAPKLSEYAYLLAEISDWEKYNLMSAPLYIFIENSYIGESEINADITKDTLQLSLGIDKNISVKRQLVKKLNEKKIIGNNRKETRGYEITIKNKKKNTIEIVIEDQIPLSTLQEIEVEMLENSNAIYDKNTGKLTWKFNMNPDEERKIIFKYSVKYPKDKNINL